MNGEMLILRCSCICIAGQKCLTYRSTLVHISMAPVGSDVTLPIVSLTEINSINRFPRWIT